MVSMILCCGKLYTRCWRGYIDGADVFISFSRAHAHRRRQFHADRRRSRADNDFYSENTDFLYFSIFIYLFFFFEDTKITHRHFVTL